MFSWTFLTADKMTIFCNDYYQRLCFSRNSWMDSWLHALCQFQEKMIWVSQAESLCEGNRLMFGASLSLDAGFEMSCLELYSAPQVFFEWMCGWCIVVIIVWWAFQTDQYAGTIDSIASSTTHKPCNLIKLFSRMQILIHGSNISIKQDMWNKSVASLCVDYVKKSVQCGLFGMVVRSL